MAKLKSQSQDATVLQEMVNTPEEVRAFGRTYLISKFTFGPVTRAMEYIGPMGFILQWLAELPKDRKGKTVATNEQMLGFAARAISIAGPSVFGLVSIATEEPIEWLESQDAMDGLKIFAKVVEKNLDFFSQSSIEKLTGMFDGLQQQIPKLGGPMSMT